MTANELRQKYLEFFKSQGHAIIPSASLVPENDPTVLFTTAGMHPLVPYLMGEKHALGQRITNCQKCIRTIDIDEVGDSTHHTFFEMLGNWSFGDYFKKEAITWSWEFLTSSEFLGLDKNRIAVSVFVGDEDAPFDQEAYDIWKNIFTENNLSVTRIAKLPKENNWWGPAGITGPCGGDTEMFYWAGETDKIPESFNDDNEKWVEIWNDVFMEFNKNSEGKYEPLKQKNVDTGMGMERTLAALNGFDDNYKTELFWPIIEKIEEISEKKYADSDAIKKAMRIIADHIKASVFIMADGVEPSNTERGYILRRLIRRALSKGADVLGMNADFIEKIIAIVQKIYGESYPEILNNKIAFELKKEEEKFIKILERGEKIIEASLSPSYSPSPSMSEDESIADELFKFKTQEGIPLELARKKMKEKGYEITAEIINIYNEKIKKHQDLSRTASAGMFKGGLADAKEETAALHTTAHLMLAGLRQVLGEGVHQRGSNINGERVRFDFSHNEKMTDEQKKQVEDFVNEAIASKTDVVMKEMSPEEAKNSGAEGEFGYKYGDRVKVYTIGEYSKEICGGPHVVNTSEIKGVFKIKKEESSSSGVRRIKAVVEI